MFLNVLPCVSECLPCVCLKKESPLAAKLDAEKEEEEEERPAGGGGEESKEGKVNHRLKFEDFIFDWTNLTISVCFHGVPELC